MADPVLVFAIGFIAIFCVMAKFTGMLGNTSKNSSEDDGIAVDVTGKPINPADAEKLEEFTEEPEHADEYETLSEDSKEDVDKFTEEVETTLNDVSTIADNMQQTLEASIEPDPTNVLYTELKLLLNFCSKKDNVSVYTDTVLISLKSKNNDNISLYNN